MERAGEDNLIERILSARAPAVVLVGPAASGKTAAARAMYHRFERDGLPACLLLVPNVRAAAQMRRKLLAQSAKGVAVAPQVLTFSALAARVLASAGVTGRLLSAFRRHLLIANIVDELAAAGKLRTLAAVADTPGLAVALERAIAELKRAAVEPETLKNALRRGDEKGRDLLAVYARFQERLHAEGVYDVEGQMWQARDYLAAGEGAAGLDGIEAAVADGFTDFTPTQLEMLALLAGSGRRVLITLPYADDGRDRLWHWTGRTLSNIRRAFAGKLQEITVGGDGRATSPGADDGAARAKPALRPLWDRLFDFDAQPCPLPGDPQLIAAPGIDAEVAAVARRVKRLLLEGRGGRIAVLVRSMVDYHEPIERIFAEHDIPISPAPQPLAGVPVVRFVLSVAALGPRFASRDVLSVINSSYFDPQALGDFDASSSAAAEMVIREGNVLAGRESYAQAAERLAGLPGRGDEENEEPPVPLGRLTFSPETIRKSSEMLERLFALSQGPSPQCPVAEKVLSIVEGLGLYRLVSSGDDPRLAARDLRAISALEAALAEIDAPAPSSARLRAALAAAACPAERCESMIDVMEVLDARSLRFEHVFLLGLSEGRFPQRFTEGPLISEADRLAWAERGAVLHSRSDLTAREMLLFYLAASRADASLTLSYMASDAAGRPMAASSFLSSLVAPAGGLESEPVRNVTEKLQAGQFIPPAGELASRPDALNAAVAELFGAGNGDGPAALAWVTQSRPEVIKRASAGLWAASHRNSRGPCDSFDGRISEPALLEILARRFGPQAVFSPTQLNTYGVCPWQFFATYVLDLAALRQPQRRLEPVARGIFCHDVLFRVMRSLSAAADGPVRLAEIDEDKITEALQSAMDAASAEVEATRPPYASLWQLQREQMHAQLRDYLLAARPRDELTPASVHFELRFGPPAEGKTPDRRRERQDPASTDQPVAIATNSQEVRLSGKIDRVDRVSFAGRQGLLVIDYKTGATPKEADIRQGRNLQLPLYAAAAEKLLGEAALGGAFHRIGAGRGGYEKLFALFKARGNKYSDNGSYEENFKEAISRVGQFVAGIRAGRFDLAPTGDCPRHCAFRQICHFSEWRAELKAAGGREESR
ncbi:MAG: PD-(D/E)XK nuclease family protein [Planctomycetota bacterium]|jgi:ATP-dependent helicase/DNAse subunit B